MKTRTFVLLLGMLFSLGCNTDGISSDRYNKLVRGIKSKDWGLRLRAIQELGQLSKRSVSAQDILIQELFTEDFAPELFDIRFFEVVKALAQTNASTVKRLISAYEKRKSPPEKLERLLIVFGRMGPKAKPAVPFLLEQLQKNTGEPDVEGSIRVTLANVGYQSDEMVATILSDLRSTAERATAQMLMMSLSGENKWVNNQVVAELVKWVDGQRNLGEWLQDHGMESSFAALALATCGEKGSPGAAPVAKATRYVWEEENYSTLRIIYGISLLKLNPSNLKEALTNVLRYMGSKDFGNHTDFSALAYVRFLMRPDIIEATGAALSQKDRNVVRGAMWMLFSTGLDGRQYAPAVAKILREDPDEDSRELAARALAYMADPGDIPAFQTMLEKEQSEFVRDEIIETIRILRLEEKREEPE
jgi:hypothetical protein